ncbi:hypothetical protein GF359_09475 [candidate division WOR-3 bacterium]|uniref:Fibronectin type-III domain-containing protein n=1 Tax=candidate division WOR-3 bacterium TaxID=2052148 RepID=A0A9D5QD72_UNCW3|nr:hypothetical protein [candidate division WOR-3 bacterium]MBD3365428.1 hypothetical protein [candidate division WOR-3 bacterium]
MAGLALCFSVCQKPEPVPAPNPVSPVDTLALEDEQTEIEFVWNSVEAALCYAIEIADNEDFNGALVFGNDELYDTTCKVSTDLFNLDSAYYWQVSAKGEDSWSAWSETIDFTPIEQDPTLGLDTTYFPLSVGYEWKFRRHEWAHDEINFEYDYDQTYSFTVKVIDQF